jgi:hypothetical protein
LKTKPSRLPKLATKIPSGDPSFPKARSRTLYYDLRLYLEESWGEVVRAYEANPGAFINAWRYLDGHPIYWKLEAWKSGKGTQYPLRHMRHLEHGDGFGNGGIWLNVTRVNPATGAISPDPALNTRTEVWLETGEFSWVTMERFHITPGTHYHNYRLDCGGETYEEAVIKMARKVHGFYGNDRRRCEPEYSERKRKAGTKKMRKEHPNWSVAVTNPYAHACRHRYPPGIAGILERAKADEEQRKG